MIAALLLAATVTAGPAGGITLQERYEEGSRAYWAGDFELAHDTWRSLADYDLRSVGLYYALGNASFRLGRAGEAKAWFERARRLDPHDGDVQANIAAVERALQGGNIVRVVQRGAAAGEGSFEWWYMLFTRLTPGQLAVLFLFFHLLFFGALLMGRWMAPGTARTLLRWGNVPVFMATVALGALLMGSAHVERSVEVAVAVSSPTSVHDGPTRAAAVLFELPEGQLVRLAEEQDGWRRARVNDDLQGWVAQGQLMGVQ